MKSSTRSSRASLSKRETGDARTSNYTLESVGRASRKAAELNPLTLTGWLFASGAFYLLGSGFATGNAYSFLLSTVCLAFLVTVAIATRLEARRAREYALGWESVAPIVARGASPTQRLVNPAFRPLPFLRAHLIIRGAYVPGRKRRYRVHHDLAFPYEPISPFPLVFPWSGMLHLTSHTEIRDITGFACARFGERRERVLPVRPLSITDRKPPRVEALQGDENQNRMKSSDVERYFMREYLPGDRERDINWKASSRYQELFTRISPVTQEKTQLITVFFRPYDSSSVDSVVSLTLLDRAKSMLLFFLRSVKAAHPEYEFRLYLGGDLVSIETEEEIDELAADLAAVHFRSYGEMPTFESGDLAGGAYVFTTACDTGINDFLSQFSADSVEVYRSIATRKGDNDRVVITLFDDIDSIIPGALLIPGAGNLRRAVSIAKATANDEYVEVRNCDFGPLR